MGPGEQFSYVLIVDDEAAIRTVLSLGLQARGRKLLCAGVSEDAKALFEKHPVAAMLLDLSLSGKEQAGLELLAWARAMRPEVKVLVLTGGCSAQSRERARELGAAAVLLKPQPLWVLREHLSFLQKSPPGAQEARVP